jgi:diacylglycerol kinase (ATP)
MQPHQMTKPSGPPPFDPLPPKRSGVLRGLYAFKHSWEGLVATWRSESAFRQEAGCAVVLIPIAALIPVAPVEHVLLIVSVLLVLLVELLNSAIEAIVDRISLERHELSGRAKDCGSAAVMIALISCGVVWAYLCGPWVLRVVIPYCTHAISHLLRGWSSG